MTLSAADGQSQPGRSKRARPVNQFLETGLLALHASFPILQPIAMKASRRLLVECRTREQVSCHLLKRKLVERHVVVQHFNDPLTPTPGVTAGQILLIAVTVSVTCQIQPLSCPLLSIVR